MPLRQVSSGGQRGHERSLISDPDIPDVYFLYVGKWPTNEHIYWVLTPTPQSIYCYYPHFPEEENQALQRKATYPERASLK